MADIRLNITINTSPQNVYEALTEQKHLAAWWTPDAGDASKVGNKAKFEFKGANFYTVMEIVNLEPSKRIEWKCIKAGDESNKEWEDTAIIWAISDKDDGTTTLRLDHQDWPSETELYKKCTDGWAYYAEESLKEYLETGKGKPFTPK